MTFISDRAGKIVWYFNGPISANQTVTSALLSGGADNTFADPDGWIPTEGFMTILRSISSDQNSATNGVKVEFADEDLNIISTATLTSSYITTQNYAPSAFAIRAAYMRYSYTNGANAGTLNFTLWLLKYNVQTAATFLSVPLPNNTFALVTHSALRAQDPNDLAWKSLNWVNGALSVNLTNTSSPLPTGAATETTLASAVTQLTAILNKIIAAPATAALQTTGNTALGTPTDAAVVDPTQPASITALLKGLLQESIAPATIGTFQSVSLAANVQQTIAANVNRRGAVITSVSGTILIACGFTATANNYTYRIVTNGVLEIPQLYAGLSISLFSTTAATVNVTLPS